MRVLGILVLSLFCQISSGQNIELSDRADISVLTVGPGYNLNDCFGHSAFRVQDPISGMDQVYNYGLFDFDTPNFYLKFAQGKLLYNLGDHPFKNFLNAYRRANRSMHEQVLYMSLKEKQAFLDFLIHNSLPENRGYLYDFFYDNCATKLPEVVTKILGDQVSYPRNFAKNENNTMRDLIHKYTKPHPWGEFGIDLALGSVIDKEATAKEYEFLPINVMASFKEATINDYSLVRRENILNTVEPTSTSISSTLLRPMYVFSLLAIIVAFLTYRDFKRRVRSRWLDFIIFLITGIVGLLVLLLWFATDHSATANNFNFLWAFMPNLIMAFYLKQKKLKAWVRKYLWTILVLLDVTIVLWLIGVQDFPLTLIPMLLLLSIRYIYLLFGVEDSYISDISEE